MTSVPDLSPLVLTGAGVTGFDVGPIMKETERPYESALDAALEPTATLAPSTAWPAAQSRANALATNNEGRLTSAE
jgi:hypothetical protein